MNVTVRQPSCLAPSINDINALAKHNNVGGNAMAFARRRAIESRRVELQARCSLKPPRMEMRLGTRRL